MTDEHETDYRAVAARLRQIDEDHVTLKAVSETSIRTEGKIDALIDDLREERTWRDGNEKFIKAMDARIAELEPLLPLVHGTGPHNPGLIAKVSDLERSENKRNGILGFAIGCAALFGSIMAYIGWEFPRH